MSLFDDLTKERNKAQKARDKELTKQDEAQRERRSNMQDLHKRQRKAFDEVNNMVFDVLRELRKVLCPDLLGCILKRADFVSAGFVYNDEVIFTGHSLGTWQLLYGEGYIKVSMLVNDEGEPTHFVVDAHGTGGDNAQAAEPENTADLTQDVLVEAIKSQIRKVGLMLI